MESKNITFIPSQLRYLPIYQNRVKAQQIFMQTSISKLIIRGWSTS